MSSQKTVDKINAVFSLEIKYDNKPSAWIKKAEKFADDLRVTVKDDIEIFRTQGKAYWVDRFPLPNNPSNGSSEPEVVYNVIQQTTDGIWVSFNYITSAKTKLERTFRKVQATQYDQKLLFYPMIPLLLLSLGLEIFLVVKMVRREFIFFTMNVVKLSVANAALFIVLTAFLSYYIKHKSLLEANFSILAGEKMSILIDCYIDNSSFIPGLDKLRGKIKRYTMTVLCFTGFYWHDSWPDSELMGITSNQLSDGPQGLRKKIKTKDAEIIIVDKKLDILYSKLIDLEEKLKQTGIIVLEKSKMRDYPEDLAKKHHSDYDELINLRLQIHSLDTQIKELETKKGTMFKEYSQEIKKILNSKKDLEEERVKQIIDYNATIAAYQDEINNYRQSLIVRDNSNEGMKSQIVDLTETINARANISASMMASTNYTPSLIIGPNGESHGGDLHSTNKKESVFDNISFDGIVQIFALALTIGFLVYLFQQLKDLVATLDMFGFFVIAVFAVFAMWIINGVRKSVKHQGGN
ncbi:MAG: hypothetical protein ACTSYA_01880 [Candidatus Kariarchaeaceae archaeon]